MDRSMITHTQGRPVVIENIAAVRSCIQEIPSASARIITGIVRIDKNIVIKILSNNIHMKKKYAKWVPHILTEEQKLLRIQCSQSIKDILISLSSLQRTATITCDESWLYLTYYEEVRYLQEEKDLVKPKRLISDPKIMIFTAFSTACIVLLTSLTPSTIFNSATMCDNIRPALKNAARNNKGIRNDLRLRIHMGNARSHTSKVTQNTRTLGSFCYAFQASHPPFPPDNY